MERLDTLTLNHNLLHNLNGSSFDGLHKLTSLSLDYNKITHIHDDSFRGLEGRFVVKIQGFLATKSCPSMKEKYAFFFV